MSSVCFFFFFNQKTAYEMRISDWSSDVCSSDLFRLDRGDTLAAGRVRCVTDQRSSVAVPETDRGGGVITRAGHQPHRQPVGFEIGRASCREKGCQYV